MNKRAQLLKIYNGDLFGINNKYTVYWLLNFWVLCANRLVDATTNTVASHGRLENFFANNNAKTLVIPSVRCKNQGYFRIPDCFAVLIGISYPTT